MLNLFFLKTFVDTVKTGSVKTAALRNFVTQPAVTQHIRLIEGRLECRLFERQHRKMTLTPSGRAFLPYAENLLKQYEEAKMKLRELNGLFRGTISIATVYSIGLYQLQTLVRAFLKKYPQINIQLEYHPFDVIYEKVAARTVDFGFVAYPKPRPTICADVFAQERMVLVQSPHHRIFADKRIALSKLHKARFVGFSSHMPTRLTVDRFLTKRGIVPATVNEYDDIETLKSAIGLGIGCSIVPEISVRRELRERTLEIIPCLGLTLKRPLGILYPKDKTFTKASQDFLDIVTKKRFFQKIT